MRYFPGGQSRSSRDANLITRPRHGSVCRAGPSNDEIRSLMPTAAAASRAIDDHLEKLCTVGRYYLLLVRWYIYVTSTYYLLMKKFF